jgi:hypothetical protein
VERFLEEKRVSYSELLKRLEIPEDAPETRVCMSCGQPMHIIRVNKYFVYFIHAPDEQQACAEKNPTGIKLPLIWSNKLLIRKQLEKYYEEVTGLKPKNTPFNNDLEVKQNVKTPH